MGRGRRFLSAVFCLALMSLWVFMDALPSLAAQFTVSNAGDSGAYEFSDSRPIPTLAHWGVIVLSLIPGAAALVTVRTRSGSVPD